MEELVMAYNSFEIRVKGLLCQICHHLNKSAFHIEGVSLIGSFKTFFQAHLAECSTQVSLFLIRYNNPTGQLETGACCDASSNCDSASNQCDYKFTICLDSSR